MSSNKKNYVYIFALKVHTRSGHHAPTSEEGDQLIPLYLAGLDLIEDNGLEILIPAIVYMTEDELRSFEKDLQKLKIVLGSNIDKWDAKCKIVIPLVTNTATGVCVKEIFKNIENKKYFRLEKKQAEELLKYVPHHDITEVLKNLMPLFIQEVVKRQ